MKRDTPMILFAGDTHGRFRHLEPIIRKLKPDALVLLGDIQAQRPLHEELATVMKLTEIWWIHGNHDSDSEADYDNLFGSELMDRNLHGRVVEVAGVHIAGLGGIFRSRVWMPPDEIHFESAADFASKCGKGNLWRKGLPLRHRSTIFPEDYFRLAEEKADVLVTHEAPNCHPNGFHALNELARSMGVKAAFHGHHHDCLDYAGCWQMMGFRAHGVGLRGVSDLAGETILAGEDDHLRGIRQHLMIC